MLKDSVTDQTSHTHDGKTGTPEGLPAALQALWEKARRVSAIIVRLRDENESLRIRLTDVESGSRDAFTEREKLIVQLAQMESRTQTAETELAELRRRNKQLEESETSIRRTLDETTVILEQTRRDLSALQSNGTGPFTKEEKEAVRNRVIELINKINARL